MPRPQFTKAHAAALREVAVDYIGKEWQRELKRRAKTWVKQFATLTTLATAVFGFVHFLWGFLGPLLAGSAGGGTH